MLVHPCARRFIRNACTLCALNLVPVTAHADFEEVRILRTEPVQVQICPPPGEVVQAPQAPPPPAPPASKPLVGGLTGKELLGGAAGAAVGGLLGNQVGSGSGRTAATIAGAGVGAYAGYKLAEEKPPAPAQAQAPVHGAQTPCTLATQYRVYYARTNGLQGDVMMSAPPTGAALMINFCGDRPCN